jgi:cobalt/nickel transport system permease protein
MAHVHLEDGAFTIEWVAIWTLIAAALIAIALYRLGGYAIPTRKLAIAAMCVAVGFAIFQIEIPVFGGVHINLTPLFGILVGPSLGSLAVLVINIFGSAIGHGGWGMIGANSIVNIVEVFLGFIIYRHLRNTWKASRFYAAFSATAIALTVSAFVALVIISISGIQGSAQGEAETFANLLVMAAANIATGMVEAVATGYIVSFIGRIRPDMLETAEGSRKPELPDSPAEVNASV